LPVITHYHLHLSFLFHPSCHIIAFITAVS